MSPLLDPLKGCTTSQISDAMQRLPGSVSLRPLHRGAALLGTAFTVRVRSGDNLFIHKALQLLRPGDVLVVDGGGDTSRALVGEIMKRVAQSRGCAGFVIWGAVRDSAAFAEDDFPCFARAVTHRGPYKHGPGECGVTVCVDGMLVDPGDIVVGDADGVVVVAAAQALEVGHAAREIARKEAQLLSAIDQGRYEDTWVDESLRRLGYA